MGTGYDLLIEKVNEFTKKFYLNLLLRGSIYAASLILLMYLLVFTYTYFFNPGIGIKTVVFFTFILLSLFALITWMLKPAMSYFIPACRMSTEEAALLIGEHFQPVKDKLLNTLQLRELAGLSPQQNSLILAGIDQKIALFKPIPFSQAIHLGENKKHIRFLFFPSALILLIALIAPAILKEGTHRFVKYNQEILPVAPFSFEVISGLKAVQGDDLTVKVRLKGDNFPQDVYVEDGPYVYKLEKKSIQQFQHTFKNIQKDASIRFHGGGFKSASYVVRVQPRPALLQMDISLRYPSYLHRKEEIIRNGGDLVIPEGTQVSWRLRSIHTQQISFILADQVNDLPVNNQVSFFEKNIRQSSSYRLVPKNESMISKDSLSHRIEVIPDRYPTIDIQETKDSISNKALYFKGIIEDDYGFSSLNFHYQVKAKEKLVLEKRIPINFSKNVLSNAFFHYWNTGDIPVQAGQSIVYYFEVADNDGVNGAKRTRSDIRTLAIPPATALNQQLNAESEALKKKMEAAIQMAKRLEAEAKKINQGLVDKKQLSFEDKKEIEQLLEKRKQLDAALIDIRQENEKQTFRKEESHLLSDELREKQRQIDQLFQQVLDEKTKELLNKLQEWMDQNQKDRTKDELSQMQMDNKSLRNELDRILELYKQLEFEQGLRQQIDRLNDLAKEQKALKDAVLKEQITTEKARAQQEELTRDFQQVKKDLGSLNEKNQALDRPNTFQLPEKEVEEIAKSQQESQEGLQQKNQQKAASKMDQASQQLSELAKHLEEEQQQGEESAQQVNERELRQLLNHLLNTSFEQEKVMLQLRKTPIYDPSYVGAVQQQHALRENMKVIADSLHSLSKRVPQIEKVVNDEVGKIQFNISKAIEQLGERRTAEANRFQQASMTSLNNLALMMNEALDQLQKNRQNSSRKGKSSRQSTQQLQQMQQQLQQNMQKAKEQMDREGNKGQAPKGSMSEQFARMAQQQKQIREALQKLNQEENKDGRGALGNLNQLLQEMKQTETDLVNKKLTEEMMQRQRNLVTRLLDAEKAQREQDEDSRRESKAGKEFPPSYKKFLESFQKEKQSETELLQKVAPSLKDYYKTKIADYFKLLNSSR